MNFKEAMQYVDGLSRFGMHLGLERISALLDKLDNPQNDLRFVHVAGTNGKGSVSSMLSNCLTKEGYTTGLFISPYVLCFRERMQVNGEMITEEDFAACATQVCRCADEMAAELASPTQFELETAIAFVYYKRRNCNIVCLEVGLGGRFDSTNCIPAPILQVITAIRLDHTKILGDSIEQIAFEKAGIIKGGETVLYPIQDAAARAVVERVCQERGSILRVPRVDDLKILHDDWKAGSFSYDGQCYQKSLAGFVQFYNGITVIEAVYALRRAGLAISDSALRHGIEQTQFAARMERLSEQPLVILDGSHNPDGASALADTLQRLAPRPITLLMGVLDDKDYAKILTILAPHAKNLFALTPDTPRALPAVILAQQAQSVGLDAVAYTDAKRAVFDALAQLGDDGILVACGSLYLASELRPILLAVQDSTEKQILQGVQT